jgi:hypothetical protein
MPVAFPPATLAQTLGGEKVWDLSGFASWPESDGEDIFAVLSRQPIEARVGVKSVTENDVKCSRIGRYEPGKQAQSRGDLVLAGLLWLDIKPSAQLPTEQHGADHAVIGVPVLALAAAGSPKTAA